MEVHECEDAVHAALKQRRPKLIVEIINKVTHMTMHCFVCVRVYCYRLMCVHFCGEQHLAEEAAQDAAGRTKKKAGIDFVCIECKEDGSCIVSIIDICGCVQW